MKTYPVVLSKKTKDFYDFLHGEEGERFSQDLSGTNYGTVWSKCGEPLRLPADHEGAAIYVPVNPCTVRVTPEDRLKYAGKPDSYIEKRVASKNSTIHSTRGLFAEFDAKDLINPTGEQIEVEYQKLLAEQTGKIIEATLRTQARSRAQEAIFALDLNYWRRLCWELVQTIEPKPSVITFTGGGFCCYWLLNERFVIKTTADLERYMSIQKRWVQRFPAADQGVHDPRRIFRPEGTTNYKTIYGPKFPKVQYMVYDLERTYRLEDLEALLPVVPDVVTEAKGKPQATSYTHCASEKRMIKEGSVIEAFNAAHPITELMLSYGYTQASGNKWNRPGTKDRACTVFPESNTMYTHSQNDPMWNKGGHRVSAFDMFKVYEHSGDFNAALTAARKELGMEKKALRPADQPASFKAVIQECRVWLRNADLANMIPQSMQSAKGYRTLPTDKRLISGVIDILAGYGKLSGPISFSQISLHSGLSEATARNSMKRVIAAGIIKRIESPDEAGGLAFWYELNRTVDCGVVRSLGADQYPAIYGTVFTEQKKEDAFQRVGSKKQRLLAKMKAFGPDACILIDYIHDHGRMTQRQIMAATHQGKNTVSRIVRILDEHEIISVERVGRENHISLNHDWLDTVELLTPEMTTFGNKNRREFNIHERTIRACDWQLARSKGDVEKLRAKREKAFSAMLLIVENEIEGMDMERQSEIMRRILRQDSLRRSAAVSDSPIEQAEVEVFNRPHQPDWFARSSESGMKNVERVMRELNVNREIYANMSDYREWKQMMDAETAGDIF